MVVSHLHLVQNLRACELAATHAARQRPSWPLPPVERLYRHNTRGGPAEAQLFAQ
jgi:hypothetical protein